MSFFSENDLISSYTSKQAIADGFLIEPYARRWPGLLITNALHAVIQAVCKRTKREYEYALVPLLNDCVMQVQATMKRHPKNYADHFPLVLEHTVAGTVLMNFNDLGGFTVMLPSDN